MMSVPLRVACVVATTGATGVERHLESLLGAFDRSSVSPVLIAPGPGPLVDRVRAMDIPVVFGAPTRKLAFRAVGDLRGQLEDRFDLVHAHGPRAAFWTALAARRSGVPFVATIHELRWTTLPPSPRRAFWILLEDMALGNADQLIAVSHAVRDQVVLRHSAWADRVSVVHGSTPVHAQASNVGARTVHATSAPLRVICVGRLDWVKGTEDVLRTLHKVSSMGLDVRGDIVGQGPMREKLYSLASSLGIVPLLRWHEEPVDIPALLRASDVFLTATRFETFGMAVLEAMAFGLPIVAPRIGGLEEIVGDDCGLLVNAEPRVTIADRLAKAVMSLSRDSDRRAALGAAARRRALEEFAPKVLAEGVLSVYRKTLQGRARTTG
jgi:glycosyltransferase involved in cell wall biosynthesis